MLSEERCSFQVCDFCTFCRKRNALASAFSEFHSILVEVLQVLERRKMHFQCSTFPSSPLRGNRVLLWKEQDIWGEKRNLKWVLAPLCPCPVSLGKSFISLHFCFHLSIQHQWIHRVWGQIKSLLVRNDSVNSKLLYSYKVLRSLCW